MAGNILTIHTVSPTIAQCLSSSSFTNLHSPHFWIVDNGATDHMVCSLSLLSTLSQPINAIASLPNGQYAQVTHIGSIQLSLHLMLQNVLYIPSFTFNLISTSKFTSTSQFGLIFLSNKCFIQDLYARSTIGVGNQKGSLYLL